MDSHSKVPLTAVDRIADGSGLQMMKAAIPYLPPSLQKTFSISVKMMEVSNLLAYYSSPVRACSASENTPDTQDVLEDIRTYCNDTQRQSLDQALNVIHTLKMYQEIQNIT